MADPNVNTNPNLKSLPGEAGNFFAGINARIREAEKNARILAEGQLLPSDVKMQIDELRRKIANNVNIVKANKDRLGETALNGLIASTNLYKTQKDNLLTSNNFEEKYANLQNEKRIARKRQREPSSVEVPSTEDMVKASEDADAALAAADEVLTEPDDELPLPPRETDSANADKLAKLIADSLTTAAQPSLIMPPAPPTAEDVEADMPAPFNVTEKPQPVPIQEPTITPGALANVIINALKLASTAPVPVPVPAPEPVQAPEPVPEPEPAQAPEPAPVQVMQEPTISPGALANVIVKALKLASTAPVPVPAPVLAPEPAPVPVTAPITQEPTILPGALANVIVNALKLATPQATTAPETAQATTAPETAQATTTPETAQATTTPETAQATTTPETAQSTVAGDKCGESPGFISLIQKYLEPIIGQFTPPETKPQKVFDKTQLPENMQRILDDANIRYIGRYRTESKPDQNAGQTQTTYLFWDTSTHDYTSHTVTDVVNEVMVKAPTEAPTEAPAVAPAPTEAPGPAPKLKRAQKMQLAKEEKERKEKETAEIVKEMPLAPTNPPVKQQQSQPTVRELIPLGPMI